MGTVTGITVGLDWSLVDNSLYNKCACYVQSSESDRVLITSLIHPDTKNCGISIKLENGDHSFFFDCSGVSYPSDVLQSHVMSISSVRKELPHGQYNVQYCLRVTSYPPGQHPVKVTCCAGSNTNCYSSIPTLPSPPDTTIPTSTTPTTTGLTTTTTATSTTTVTITGSRPDTSEHQPSSPLPPTSSSSEPPHTGGTDTTTPVGTASPSQLKGGENREKTRCVVIIQTTPQIMKILAPYLGMKMHTKLWGLSRKAISQWKEQRMQKSDAVYLNNLPRYLDVLETCLCRMYFSTEDIEFSEQKHVHYWKVPKTNF